MREAYPQIRELGAEVLAVGTGADYQAQRLRADGVPFPCLLDPERNLYRALGLGHIRWYRFLQPKMWLRYLRSSRRARAADPGAKALDPAGDVMQAPGVVILDTERRVRYAHLGQNLADYPPLDEVIRALRELTA